MKLLVIRHGAAMDREEFAETGKPDDERPLTPEGMSKMKQIAKGLRSEVDRLDVLAASPLVRARQTADIVAREYGIGAPEITDTLVPDTPFATFEKWCSTHEKANVIAVVGHEPHLSSLIIWLLAGEEQEEEIKLKKGGACLLDFKSEVERDSATLDWLLKPRQLAKRSR